MALFQSQVNWIFRLLFLQTEFEEYLPILMPHTVGDDKFTKKYKLSYFQTPVDIYLLKVNNRNTKTGCEICSKLTIKTPERRQWRCSRPALLDCDCALLLLSFTITFLFSLRRSKI